MEKRTSWRDVPASLFSGTRGSKFLRIAIFVAACLVLTSLLSSDVRAHAAAVPAAVSNAASSVASSHASSGEASPAAEEPPKPTGGATVPIRLAKGITSKGAEPSAEEKAMMDAAGNSTLGFGAIKFINLRGRYDRLDAATLQAHLSGIDIEEVQGVDAKELSDVGLPPEHLARNLKQGEKGCWRAHADIWSQMLRDKTPAVLIIESDAVWDLEVREIMHNMNLYMTQFLHELNSTRLPNPGYRARREAEAARADGRDPDALVLDPEDPWHSGHWDMLSVGQCFEDSLNKDTSIRFPDPNVKPGMNYFGSPLGEERVVRLSGGIVCTTAYAISQTGAAKLLLRSALDLDNPIDLLMRRMIKSEDLLVYSVMPTVFGQWEYIDGIGMAERGANSDINNGADEGEPDLSGYENVLKTGSIWQDRVGHEDVAFSNMALERAWSVLMGTSQLAASQYSEVDGN